MNRGGRPLGFILTTRIALFAALAMLSQLAIVLADYYWNDQELSRLLVERETERLFSGLSASDGSLSFTLPDELRDRYGMADTGYFARIRTVTGDVLFSACGEECAEHLLPLDFRPPSFWMRTIQPGKPLTLAGGRNFSLGNASVLVEVAVIGDPQEAVWGVLWHEVLDHMLVPMGIILVFVLGATLASVRAAIRPVRSAALAAEALDPLNTNSHLDTSGMPREVAQLAEAVNRAFARVGELMRAQKLLTSAIAHEVRTPLAIVKLELERIDHPRARKAEADLDELVRFVEQLSALAKLEAVDLAPFTLVDVNRLAEDLVAGMAPWIYQHGHAVALEAEGKLQVDAIDSLLLDAIRNLLENAVRHTPNGTSITVRIRDDSIAIVDDGGGFERRVDPELSSSIKKGGGLGIGLQIVKRIADLHGAEFRIEHHDNRTEATLIFTGRKPL